MATEMAPTHQVDRGFAWLVLAVSFFIHGVSSIAPYCGVYVAAIIDGYHTNRTEGYIVGALSIGFFYVSGPIASVVMDKSSPRTVGLVGSSLATIGLLLSANVPSIFYLYATFSITGIGCGFMNVLSIVLPIFYFDKHLALATSVTISSAGVAYMVYPVFCQLIIDEFTWQPSLYIVAGICLNAFVAAMVIGSSPSLPDGCPQETNLCKTSDENPSNGEVELNVPQMRQIQNGTSKTLLDNGDDDGGNVDGRVNDHSVDYNWTKDVDDLEICEGTMKKYVSSISICIVQEATARPFGEQGLLRNRPFLLFMLNVFMSTASLFSVLVAIPDMYNVAGISVSHQKTLFVAFGLCSITGRLLSGCLWLRWVSPMTVFCLTNFIWSSAIILHVHYTDFTCLLLAAGLTSMMYGSYASCFPVVTLDIVGLKHVGRAYGYVNMASGLGGALGPPILGVIYDATLDYTWPVLVAAMLGLASAAVVAPTAFAQRHSRRC